MADAQARAWRRGELKSQAVEDLIDLWRRLKENPRRLGQQGWSHQIVARWEDLLALDEEDFAREMNKSYGSRPADRPAYWDDAPFNHPCQPVVGVAWFEARAYCLWLQDRWRAAGDAAQPPLAPGQGVALPSEAAWERAARYPRGGRYPWGRRWSPERANTAEGRVLRTTPVGVYPSGATAQGIHDLSGNVWEWTASLYRDYPYRPEDGREEPQAEGPRVVRGGSWGSGRRVARCAYRSWDHPGSFNVALGFRVVVSLADSDF